MPITRNNFDRFTDTSAADERCLTRIGLAALMVAKAECPVQTGNLRRSHTFKVEGDHVDVGVTADYGGHVHNGTSTRKANPWLKRSINRNRDSIMQLGATAWEEHMNE